MKKVLHILPNLNIYGGTPKKTLDLINYSKNKHIVYTWGKLQDEKLNQDFLNIFLSNKIQVYQGDYKNNIIFHCFKIGSIIMSKNIKILHAYFETGSILAFFSSLFFPKVKIIASFVGFPDKKKILKKILFNLSLKWIDEKIFVSKYTYSAYCSYYSNLKKFSHKVIYNGTIKPIPIKSYSIKLPSNNHPTITSISGLVEWKNISIILEAIYYLKINFNLDVNYIVIGDGPDKEKLINLTKKLNIKKSVNFIGFTSAIGNWLSISDIYVHPSLKEGFGISVVEAMLSGCPVIVSNAGALPEIVIHKKNGLVVDRNNPILWAEMINNLLNNKKLKNKLIINGKKYALEKFSINQFVNNFDKIYSKYL